MMAAAGGSGFPLLASAAIAGATAQASVLNSGAGIQSPFCAFPDQFSAMAAAMASSANSARNLNGENDPESKVSLHATSVGMASNGTTSPQKRARTRIADDVIFSIYRKAFADLFKITGNRKNGNFSCSDFSVYKCINTTIIIKYTFNIFKSSFSYVSFLSN